MTIQLSIVRPSLATCPVCHIWIDKFGRCNCNSIVPGDQEGEEGYDLDLFPWEDAALAIAEAEAIFEEMESKPGLGVDDGYDPSLDFDMLLAEVQATGGWTSPVTATLFEEEHIGLHFARNPWQY